MTIQYKLNIAAYPVESLVKIVSDLLDSIIAANDPLIENDSTITHFHSRDVPNITVNAYLSRILKYTSFTNDVLLSILVYFDRIVNLKKSKYAINSLTVHRLLITSIVVASKFTSDIFYPNTRYAKVGGIPLGELNQLELEFLFLCNFDLHVKLEDMQAYGDQLLTHALTQQLVEPIKPLVTPLEPKLALVKKRKREDDKLKSEIIIDKALLSSYKRIYI